MKGDWKVGTLADFNNKIIGGGTPSKKVPIFWNGNIKWASVKDFIGDKILLSNTVDRISELGLKNSSAHLIKSGVPILCARMAVGKCSVFDVDVAINQDLKAIYPNDLISSEYLLVYLRFKKDDIASKAIGSTVKGITLNSLLKIEFKIPPLPQQKKIAKILSTCDAVIAQTEAAIAKYEAIKKGMMHDLFTRGIDVTTGKLRPRVEDAPELYKESELGMVPVDWEVDGILEKCDEIFLGLTTKVDYVEEGGVPLIRAKDVNTGYLKFDEVLQISKRQHKDLTKNRKAKRDDVLITKSGTLGISAIVDSDIEFSIYESIIVLQCKESILFPKFLLWLLREPITLNRLLGQTVGSTIGHLNLLNFRELKVVFPQYKEQEAISSVIDGLHLKLERERTLVSKYQTLKQGLMQDLLTGRVDVAG